MSNTCQQVGAYHRNEPSFHLTNVNQHLLLRDILEEMERIEKSSDLP